MDRGENLAVVRLPDSMRLPDSRGIAAAIVQKSENFGSKVRNLLRSTVALISNSPRPFPLWVRCETQAEVDHYWDGLREGGDERAQQCG